MEIRQGYSYHIKDEFFDLVQGKYLMSNKEQGNYSGGVALIGTTLVPLLSGLF